MTLHLAVCFVMVVALMTANGLTGTTTVYAAHSKHSSNQTSFSGRGSHNNNSPSSRHQDLEPQAARTAVEPGAQVIHLHRQELALLQGVAVPVQELMPHQQ